MNAATVIDPISNNARTVAGDDVAQFRQPHVGTVPLNQPRRRHAISSIAILPARLPSVTALPLTADNRDQVRRLAVGLPR
jgi:hypothetical protein